jgi:hypothetical protein
MRQLGCGWIVLVLSATLSGCVTLAPGADKVKLTSNAADVKGCVAVGNVKTDAQNDPLDVDNTLRNQAVGLNADVVFRTGLGAGVGYRCAGTATP